MIRLVQKGDAGKEELEILRELCTGHNAFLGDNHCLPVLRILSVNDMIFAVFPLLAEGFRYPWYQSIAEVMDSVTQISKVPVPFTDHRFSY